MTPITSGALLLMGVIFLPPLYLHVVPSPGHHTSLCSAISRQQIVLESCSHSLKMRKVL